MNTLPEDTSSAPRAYEVRQYPFPTKRYVRCLSLRPDSRIIAEYRRRHSRGVIWPEVLEGIRSVGVLGMDIYIHGTTLTMIMETASDFDWDTAMARLATLPRQQEWEDFMVEFQDVVTGSTPAEKWLPMERKFNLYDPD